LVAPIRSDEQFLKVYLPEGNWYEFFTDEQLNGNQESIREYGLEHLPLFVKASSIIPTYPEVGVNTKEIGELLEIHLYNGDERAATAYYEDDGTTYAFEQGDYHKRELVFDPTLNSFTLSEVEGDYPSKMKRLKVVLHGFSSINSSEFKAVINSFVDPISHFDPIGEVKPNLLKSNVQVLETNYSNDEITISW